MPFCTMCGMVLDRGVPCPSCSPVDERPTVVRPAAKPPAKKKAPPPPNWFGGFMTALIFVAAFIIVAGVITEIVNSPRSQYQPPPANLNERQPPPETTRSAEPTQPSQQAPAPAESPIANQPKILANTSTPQTTVPDRTPAEMPQSALNKNTANLSYSNKASKYPTNATNTARPPGATAECRDGTFSIQAPSNIWTCSGHGGVKRAFPSLPYRSAVCFDGARATARVDVLNRICEGHGGVYQWVN